MKSPEEKDAEIDPLLEDARSEEVGRGSRAGVG